MKVNHLSSLFVILGLKNNLIKTMKDNFPSPPWIVQLLLESAQIQGGELCLEPSSGSGNLAIALQQAGVIVNCIETNPDYQFQLIQQGFKVIGSDFLLTPNLQDAFDLIVMNPPFSEQISHVRRAFACLKPQGRLVALISHSPWQYHRPFYQQFRTWLQGINAEIRELPSGLFLNAEHRADVSCVLLIINKYGYK